MNRSLGAQPRGFRFLAVNFIDPSKYNQTPLTTLLEAAAYGSIGVDRRVIQAILDHGVSAAAEILAYARKDRKAERIGIDPLLIDLFRHFKAPEALDFFVDTIRRNEGDVDDELVQALLPFGEKAVVPLIKLDEELGEEQGQDVAFALAGLRVRDERVLTLLSERLEYDVADGALCLSLYGDPAARPALEGMLAEVPESDPALRREINYALEQLESAVPPYEPEPFDILKEYPERDIPAFDLLSEAERLEAFASTDPLTRAEAAHSFFNHEVSPKARAALIALTQSDDDSSVRGRAWESLADATEDEKIRAAMLAVLSDTSKPLAERGGAAVGLHAVAERDDARAAIVGLYQEGGKARIKALEAMWRGLWKPYAQYFAPNLDDSDPAVVKEALRGAGYFQLTKESGKIASYFDRDEPFDDLRDDALFAYALAMPGETTRGRIRGMFRKVDEMADLSGEEADLVMFALDERLRLKGLEPVFANDGDGEEEPEPKPQSIPPAKTGRNDPCPCGSGKKYKKCHGA